MSGVPILVEATSLPVLVVGGGEVAVRKAAALAHAGADVRVVASAASEEMRALAQAARVRLTERAYERGDIADAMLVVAATDDRAVNASIAEDARAAKRLVNRADAPADGTFATMAAHRSGALVIGVTTGGVPGAAARIRDVIATRFDDRYATALAGLASLRRSLLDRGNAAAWRSLSAEVIDSDFCEAIERDTLEARMATWR